MQSETLKQLEQRLEANLLTEQDIINFRDLGEKYEDVFNAYIKEYRLEDMPEIREKLKEIFRITHIKDYFLQIEAINHIEQVLQRMAN